MKKKKIIKIIVSILIAVAILGLGFLLGRITNSRSGMMQFNNNATSSTDSSTTQTVEVEVGTQTIENTLTSSGQISSSESENISLNTSYYFNQMCVEEDDTVLAGENILEYTNGTYLTAEYDCVISSYSVPDSGSICTSSNYIQVQKLDTLTMTLSIDESEINSVEVGQEVEIELNAFEDITYTGEISKIDAIGTYSSSGTTFTATIEFENDGNVKIGMSASCTIIIEKAEDVIAVPIEAVQTSGEQKYVIVVNDDGTTENVDIETGISNDSYVEVKSGLSGGEKIQMISTTSNTQNGGFDMSGVGGSGMDMSGFDSSSMPEEMQMLPSDSGFSPGNN